MISEFARFAGAFSATDLPPALVERGKWILADCIGVACRGAQAPEMAALTKIHLRSASAGPAWIIGARVRSTPLAAAFLNGIAGTWNELDEGCTLAKGHPAIQLVPAALAEAQLTRVSGRELLAAIAIGYELSSRINRAGRIRPSVHPHGTFGVIGAALAVARVRKLPAGDYARLINIASGLALASSYNTINEGATVRNVFTGHSGVMGINAADLTQAGFTGEANAAAMTYGTVLGESFSPEVALAGLGTEWMMAGNYFKLQPTARSVHPAIDAVEDALSKVPGSHIEASQVSAIAVRTYWSASIKAQKDISTAFGAKFSIPFAVATRIVNGSATLDCFDEDDVSNPAIQLLLQKVDVVEDPAMTAAWPASQPCDVDIRMKDGTLYSGRCVIVRGEPQRPNTLDEVRGKFINLTVPVWGDKFSSRMWNECMTMDKVEDVARWGEQFEL